MSKPERIRRIREGYRAWLAAGNKPGKKVDDWEVGDMTDWESTYGTTVPGLTGRRVQPCATA